MADVDAAGDVAADSEKVRYSQLLARRLQLIGRDLDAVAVWIAKVDRVTDLVICELVLDTTLLEGDLGGVEAASIAPKREMAHRERVRRSPRGLRDGAAWIEKVIGSDRPPWRARGGRRGDPRAMPCAICRRRTKSRPAMDGRGPPGARPSGVVTRAERCSVDAKATVRTRRSVAAFRRPRRPR